MDSQLVWAPDPCHGYMLGKVVDIGANNKATIHLEPPLLVTNNKSSSASSWSTETKRTECSITDVLPAETDLKKDHDDNCSLMYLNEANLLHNVRLRYFKNKIYTYVANILIALNPYHDLGEQLYSCQVLKSYQGKSLGKMPPHVFAIADKAYYDMRRMSHSQSIIVSGESGAGKTESTKYILRYLCESFGDNSQANSAIQIEKLILEANPLLEAFGNAKTSRNNNSSRFGKFIEIYMNRKYMVAGGHISHYLLEKSRICGISSCLERNYHIFYQLCVGLPQDMWNKLRLKPPDKFAYLNKGCTRYFLTKNEEETLNKDRKSAEHIREGHLCDSIVNDLSEFAAMDRALHHFGVSDQDKFVIYQIVAAVLHLGNINFEESTNDSHGGCRVKEDDNVSQQALLDVSQLLGVDKDQLQQCLQTRIMQTNKGGYKGSVYMVPLKVHEAQNARDALAKAIYSRLFDYIVSKIINKALPLMQQQEQQQQQQQHSTNQNGSNHNPLVYSIGVLDIAGFEYFQINSFEQFCINYCNETLQNFFNERILNDEQKLYDNEGLGLKRIDYVDNRDCIELLEAKSCGIFDLLDEESRLPKPSAQHFTEMVHKTNGGKFRLDVPRKSKLKIYRELRDDEGFIIRHFAGAVCYQTGQFIEKNNDSLHTNLAFLMLESNNAMLRSFFQADNVQQNHHFSSTSLADKSVRLSSESVGSKFRKQLSDLIKKLQSTGTHFVRCIKPNLNMVSQCFDGGCILSQLKCSGMTSVLQLMQYGYPSRATYHQIYQLYAPRLPTRLAGIEPRFFCHALIKALGLADSDVCFGVTKVFFRPGRFAEFDMLLKNDDPKTLDQLVSKVQHWLLASRWRRSQWCALCVVKLKNKIIYRRHCIITVQKYIRMYLAMKRFQPHYQSIKMIKQVDQHLAKIEPLVDKIQMDSEKQLFIDELNRLKQSIKAIHHDSMIVANEPAILDKNQVDKSIGPIRANIDTLVARLELALSQQELRLKLLQEQLEQERQKEAEEVARRKEQEELRKKKAELEERRRLEIEQNDRILASQTVLCNNGNNISQSSSSSSLQDSSISALVNEEERQKQIDYLKRLEQERRDYELALRLSQDANNAQNHNLQAVIKDEDIISYNPSLIVKQHLPILQQHRTDIIDTANSKKNKLESWNYAKLRDTINTSNDIELLEACREEFHRRLKVYHQWKYRNNNSRSSHTILPSVVAKPQGANRSTSKNVQNQHFQASMNLGNYNNNNSQRAPISVMTSFYSTTDVEQGWHLNQNNDEGRHSVRIANTELQHQRYFRLPFDRHCGQSKGIWYAHFDGKWIARQMEIHPEKEPILLIAGRDDLKMCELSLDETGLTGKRGAEILPEEFEAVWSRNGGQPYHRIPKG